MVLTDKASAPTVRYRQGVDYDLNARTGLLRVRESCSADTVFLTADCESSDEQLVDALTASDVTGELLFVGQPDQGPGLVVQCWKVTLSLSGEVGLISEDVYKRQGGRKAPRLSSNRTHTVSFPRCSPSTPKAATYWN